MSFEQTHSITARYSGDINNAANTSAALLQTVNVLRDSIGVRQMQLSTTPIIAQVSGQAISSAIDSAINAGFSDNPPRVTPNGGGFSVQVPLDQPPVTTPRIRTPQFGGSSDNTTNFALGSPRSNGASSNGPGSNGSGSLANGRQGGNGAPPGTRLIDMAVIALPPGSGTCRPSAKRGSPPNEVSAMQFSAGTTPQRVCAAIVQRFGLTVEAQRPIGVLGRAIYTLRIGNGQSVRQAIGAVEGAQSMP